MSGEVHDPPEYEYRVARIRSDGVVEWAWPFDSEADARHFLSYNEVANQRIQRAQARVWEDVPDGRELPTVDDVAGILSRPESWAHREEPDA